MNLLYRKCKGSNNFYIYGRGDKGLLSRAIARAISQYTAINEIFFEWREEHVGFDGCDGQPVIIGMMCERQSGEVAEAVLKTYLMYLKYPLPNKR